MGSGINFPSSFAAIVTRMPLRSVGKVEVLWLRREEAEEPYVSVACSNLFRDQ